MPSQTPLGFIDITNYAKKYHDQSCPCKQEPESFQSHDPNQSQSSENFLLLHGVSQEFQQTSDQWVTIARNHFLILAQKYHPDKNPILPPEICHNAMTLLNLSYNDLIQRIRFEEHNIDEVIIDRKLYTKINHCTVTCRHLSSYSIYGFPDDANQWTTKIKQNWGSSPSPIKARNGKKLGQQFGNEKDSIYISVYDNGTIHVQGIMAIQYAEEVIIPFLTEWFKPKAVVADRKRFSDLLKKAIGLFKKENTNKSSSRENLSRLHKPIGGVNPDKPTAHPISLSKSAQSNTSPGTTDISTQDITNQKPDQSTKQQNQMRTENTSTSNKSTSPATQVKTPIQSVTISASLFIELSEKINRAEKRISELESSEERINIISEQLQRAEDRINELEESKERDRNQLATAINHIEGLENAITTLKKENNQLKEQTGPKIGQLTRQIDQMKHMQSANSGQKTSFQQVGLELPEDRSSYAQHAAGLNNSDINRFTPPKSSNNRIVFEREKCIVITDIQNPEQIKSDDEIRKVIGNQHRVVIDRISRSRNGNIFVQLADSKNVDQVISSWNENNFGGSSITKSEQPQLRLGVLKGVPLYMEDIDIQTDLRNTGFRDADVKRITKKGQPTRAVRVRFNNSGDLEKAIRENILLQNLVIRVEELILQPRVTQCYNCYKFNHVAEKCESSKTCPRCAEPFDESHESCNKEVKCVNCKKAHPSSDKKCPIFIQLLNTQKVRIQNFYNGIHNG